MTPSLSKNCQMIDDFWKTDVISDELQRLNVDIASLQEMQLAGSGILKEKDHTFFWQGISPNDSREQGVGFAVKDTMLQFVELGDNFLSDC